MSVITRRLVGGGRLPAAVLATLLLAGCGSAGADDGTAEPVPTPAPATSVPPPPRSTPPAADSRGSGAPASPTVGAYREIVAQLATGVADEASGAAVSARTPGAYFLVDDAPGTSEVVAVNATGELLGRTAVDGMSAENAEALSSGPCGAPPLPGPPAATCLYVGDIGDNRARRGSIAVYRMAEPAVNAPDTGPVPADEWRYTYPDGPHNAESMLIDADGSILVITKPARAGSPPHRMYRGAPGGGEMVLLREFRPPDATPAFRTMITGNVVTDIAAGPGRVLLLTYDEVQQYTAPTPSAPLSSFPDWPHRELPLGGLPQAEGVAPATDGCGYVVASEGGPGGDHGSLTVVTCPARG